MSYRRRRANNSAGDIKGPSSALTSFLKEQGINAEAIKLRYEQNLAKQQEQEQKALEKDDDEEDAVKIELSNTHNDVDSDEEELQQGNDDDSHLREIKKRKLEQVFDDEEEPAPNGGSSNDIIYCIECDRKFEVGVFTKKIEKYGQKGYLCKSCTQIQLRQEKLSKRIEIEEKKRRKNLAKALLDQKNFILPTLQDFCIKVITENITQYDDLNDDIGYHNKTRICNILSKNRSLNNKTIDLFLKPDTKILELWDCSKIDKGSYDRIASYCPQLERLVLNMCGQFHNDNLAYMSSKMENLTHLELNGSFLINDAHWQSFFQSKLAKSLKSLSIKNTHRLSNDSLITLLENCGNNLESLSLTRLDGLNSKPAFDLLPHFLTHLRHLDLSSPHDESLIDDDLIINILAVNCETIQSLKLNGCSGLTDKFLVEGVKPFGAQLTSLYISELDQITDEGITEVFNENWANMGILELDLSRCIQLTDRAIYQVLKHSKDSLIELNLNSVNEITSSLFKKISRTISFPLLTKADLSFIRCIDDSCLAIISRICPSLKVLEVFGDNKCTIDAKTRADLTIIGRQ